MRYAIRALKLNEILDQAIKLTKDHFGVFLGIVAILLIPYYVVSGLIQVTMMPVVPPNAPPEQLMEAGRRMLAITLPIGLVGAFLVGPITNASLIYGVANAYLGEPISIGDSYGRAFRRVLPLIGTWFLVLLAIVGGLILCVVPGILAGFWFFLATQVVVLEDVGGFAAMRRSKALMAGNVGTMFGLSFILGFINFGITFGANFIPQPHARVLAVALAEGVVAILSSAAFVVFYFSCRCKHEQFDLALLAQSVGAETPEGKPAVDPDAMW